mmetsp:Transcript_4940/g.13149  ORF Transcript_4940/g.13149 Transcript_4940/m.13149 type:complete len:422 (+) Transcript_4940:123-1388(+)
MIGTVSDIMISRRLRRLTFPILPEAVKTSGRKACLGPAWLLVSFFILQLAVPSNISWVDSYKPHRGFVTGSFCHPFALPKYKTRLSFKSIERKLTGVGPGYCLCDDDEKKTAIADLKGCGSKPIMCEKACAERVIVGEKAAPCIHKTHRECSEWSSHENMQMPSDDILELAREFHMAIGPHLGVKLPRGSRRNLYQDFVMHERRISKADVEKVRQRIDEFKRNAPKIPVETVFRGRGIVIVGGSSPKFSTSFWIAVHAIRRTGSKLPIQIWFPEGDMPDCGRISELGRLNVTVSSFSHLNRSKDGFVEVTNRFMFKIIALLFSPFDEVLLLDSDNIILRDPEELFSSASFASTGSLLWLDFWRRSSAPDCQLILGNGTAVFHTHESGQVVMKKSVTWEALALAIFMNAHSYFFFPLTVNYM